jgi:hypothetical protein
MSERSSSEIQFDETRAEAVPPGLKSAICRATSQLCAERCGGMLRAIVLTGSLAREEATFVRQGQRWGLWGDAEFLLVFDQEGVLPSSSIIDRLEREIERHVLQGGLSAHVELGPVHTGYLRTMPPEIFAYELRTHGQVAWGDRQILSLIPAFSRSDIPLEDGWRILCNRVVEFIEVIDPVVEKPVDPPPEGRYRMMKLYLDMATSFLLFQGAYAPTYLERAERLRALAEDAEANCNCPFPLRDFAQRVVYCTKFKLQAGDGVDAQAAEEGLEGMFSWAELVAYARGLWRWELEQLTGEQDQISDRELMRTWMQLQPLQKRLRGWAYVLRASGWHRSWRHWPHWVRLGWRASPRYWVYAAASELFFKLNDLLALAQEPRSDGVDIHELRSWLPLLEGSRESGVGSRKDATSFPQGAWQRLAAEIAWNYREFLEGTRA